VTRIYEANNALVPLWDLAYLCFSFFKWVKKLDFSPNHGTCSTNTRPREHICTPGHGSVKPGSIYDFTRLVERAVMTPDLTKID
jgi:hypothetical protein